MTRKLTPQEIESLISFIKPQKGIPPESARSVVHRAKEEFRSQLREIEVYPELLPKLKRKLHKMYRNSLVEPGESVGILCAQSIGEKQTQSTLNSVDYLEYVYLIVNKKHKVTPIGEFIDDLMKNMVFEGDHHVLEVKGIEVPSLNCFGQVSWQRVTAVTRHTVSDSNPLVMVKTRTNRVIMATRNDSFLVWNGDEFQTTRVQVGDRLPVLAWPFTKCICCLFPCFGRYETINDMLLDPVVSITPMEPTHTYVYDLSVENTQNFILHSGVGMRDSFHTAGLSQKIVLSSVPRFVEILNATEKPKVVSCTLYFRKNYTSLPELRKDISHSLVALTLKQLSISTPIIRSKPTERWYPAYEILHGKIEYEHCVTYQLDLNLLYRYRLDLNTIAYKIEEKYTDLRCVFSPLRMAQLDVFVDIGTLELPEDRLLFVTEDNMVEIYFDEVVIPNLEKLILCGIPGVEQIFFSKDSSDAQSSRWLVETQRTTYMQGSNFPKFLSHPLVDMTRVVSNNVWDIYHTLGVEAARQFLIEELQGIIDDFINPAHLTILVDAMTFSGTVSPMSRYGIKREEVGPMAKASFEESLENFLKAGIYGEKETTKGVSASIICGKVAPVGTGLCELMLDTSKLS